MAKIIAEMLVETVTMELPDVKTVHLKWPEGYDPGDFKTGQFITVYWPHKTKYKRAYSLSSSGLDRGFYDVTVKRDGKMGTSIVDWVEAGDKLFVIPPAGRFLPVFDPPGKHLICVAGGSGVTPFRGFVREATARDLDTRITVLYTVKTTQDIIFEKEFRELEAQNPRFNAQLRSTVVPTIVKGGIRENILPPDVEINFNARLLPGDSIDDVIRALMAHAEIPKYQVVEGSDAAVKKWKRERKSADIGVFLIDRGVDAPPSSLDTDLYRALILTARRISPASVAIPRMSTGATDLRFFRMKGVQCYGVSPCPVGEIEESTPHHHNERVRVDSVKAGLRFMLII